MRAAAICSVCGSREPCGSFEPSGHGQTKRASHSGDMYPQYWTSSVGGIFMRYSYEYKMKGYQGLAAQRKGRSPKEPAMKKQIVPAELTPSERKEMIRLRAENERLRAEIAVVKKEIALREERCAAQLKAKKLRSSKNSANMNTNEIVSYNLSTSSNMAQIKDMLNKAFKRFPSTQGLIISTITITAGPKRKQNGCLPLNSGKHPGWKLNYSILNRCILSMDVVV